MNPLGGLSAIIGAFAEADAFTKRRDAELQNMAELERSAAMEEQNATAVLQRGAMAVGAQRQAGTALGGQQRLAYAMGSIDSTSGTAAQTQRSSAIFNELDAQTLQNNAVREAFGHKESARRYAAASKKIRDYYLAPGSAFGSPADTEFGLKLASSALMSAASFGMGG